jgi:hypothetical protein
MIELKKFFNCGMNDAKGSGIVYLIQMNTVYTFFF